MSNIVPKLKKINFKKGDGCCDVYVSRGCKECKQSEWYNHETRAYHEGYKKWLNTQEDLKPRLYELVGQTLGCSCYFKLNECHAVALIDEVKKYLTNFVPKKPDHALIVTPLRHLKIRKRVIDDVEQLPNKRASQDKCQFVNTEGVNTEGVNTEVVYTEVVNTEVPTRVDKTRVDKTSDESSVEKRWVDMSLIERSVRLIEMQLKSTIPANLNTPITNGYITNLLNGKTQTWDPFVCIVKKRIYKRSIDRYMIEAYDGICNYKLHVASQVQDLVKYKIINKEDRIYIKDYACTKVGVRQRIIIVTSMYPLVENIDIQNLVVAASDL